MRRHPDPQLTPVSQSGWRRDWFEIIYRHDTPQSRAFDLILIVAILASVLVIMADSEARIHAEYGHWLYWLEWAFTVLFTIEYALRLLVVSSPRRYAGSTWGIIDLASILPTYLSLFVPGSESLLAVRILRTLRLFRIMKLTRYLEESSLLVGALLRSRRKILLFFCAVLTIAVIFGALMYVVEGPEHGFSSIPVSMYWAIVTLATVGFGDIAPQTAIGRLVTSLLILIGYSIIAVPTGIYTAELAVSLREDATTDARESHRVCSCGAALAARANYCSQCGLDRDGQQQKP